MTRSRYASTFFLGWTCGALCCAILAIIVKGVVSAPPASPPAVQRPTDGEYRIHGDEERIVDLEKRREREGEERR